MANYRKFWRKFDNLINSIIDDSVEQGIIFEREGSSSNRDDLEMRLTDIYSDKGWMLQGVIRDFIEEVIEDREEVFMKRISDLESQLDELKAEIPYG